MVGSWGVRGVGLFDQCWIVACGVGGRVGLLGRVVVDDYGFIYEIDFL